MTSRAELDQLTQAQAALVSMAERELRQAFGALDLSDPYAARDAMLEVYPAVVRRYGDLAASVAVEWFEDVYAMPAQMADPLPTIQSTETVRYTAGHLFSENPSAFLSPVLVKLDRLVKQPGRDTLASSAQKNGLRYVRVPKGAKTCAFCLTMASRAASNIQGVGDYTYSTRYAAGAQGTGNEYHGKCDCAVMPLRDDESLPRGYDPNALYDMYLSAGGAGGADIKTITANMRRDYPDMLTDAVSAN